MSSKTILIIEDDSDTRTLMKFALRAPDLKIETAASGTQAFTFLESSEKPDLVLLDLTLPEMTGEEFMQKLRADSRYSELKVLIVSGWDDLRQIASNVKANGFIRKPFQVGTLQAEIRKHF